MHVIVGSSVASFVRSQLGCHPGSSRRHNLFERVSLQHLIPRPFPRLWRPGKKLFLKLSPKLCDGNRAPVVDDVPLVRRLVRVEGVLPQPFPRHLEGAGELAAAASASAALLLFAVKRPGIKNTLIEFERTAMIFIFSALACGQVV